MSLHSAGLSSSAILCIRSLRDPRPGSLRLQHPDSHLTIEWERAVIGMIEQLVRAAPQPIDGAVPASAQAVLFRERSEMLACIALDWCAGELTLRWWWKSLLRSGELDRTVIDTWLEEPSAIPSALHWLDVKRQSAAFIRRLSVESSHQMLRKLVTTYGLFGLEPIIVQEEFVHPVHFHSMKDRSILEEQDNANSSRVNAPWHHYIQDHSIEGLPANRQLLLGVGLMLHGNPSFVRTTSFVQQVKDWQSTIDNSQSDEPHEASGESMAGSERATDLTYQRSEINLSDEIDSSTNFSSITSNISSRNEYSITKENIAWTSNEVKSTFTESLVSSSDGEMALLEITSQFGGVCYFINLGLFLNLYSDFTSPLQPGIDLSIWDFVALISQQIIGDVVTGDPLWSLLARLAGRREEEVPGMDFKPSGYESMQAWLDELMLTACPRLQLALGVDSRDLAGFFTQPAHIIVTATRFDAYFALAALPIEIRLSGLDRDPGWVPAAGKFIGFHYE